MLSETTTAITAKDGQSAQFIWTGGQREGGRHEGKIQEERMGGEERISEM